MTDDNDMSQFSGEFKAFVDSAVGLHEMFLSYLEAGFTEDQALKLIAYMIAGFKKGDST